MLSKCSTEHFKDGRNEIASEPRAERCESKQLAETGTLAELPTSLTEIKELQSVTQTGL